MRGRWMRGGGAGLRGCRCARSQRHAELGQGPGQLGSGPEPAGDLQWHPEAVLAWWGVDDRPADRTWVEVLAGPPGLIARLGGDAAHAVGYRVTRAECG